MVLLQDNPSNDFILLNFEKFHPKITKKILFTIAVEILEVLRDHEIHWQLTIQYSSIKHWPLGSILLTQEFLVDLSNAGFRSDFDDRDLSVGKKVREAEKEWIPFILVVGKNEVESNEFQVRDRYSGEMITMSLSELTEHCKNLSAQMISDELPLPKFISNRPQFK